VNLGKSVDYVGRSGFETFDANGIPPPTIGASGAGGGRVFSSSSSRTKVPTHTTDDSPLQLLTPHTR
jgi:hypothetical protein